MKASGPIPGYVRRQRDPPLRGVNYFCRAASVLIAAHRPHPPPAPVRGRERQPGEGNSQLLRDRHVRLVGVRLVISYAHDGLKQVIATVLG